MLEIDGLSRYFGSKAAITDVSLRIDNGAFVGVIGRSGAGKSTLLRTINRLVEPTSGRIVYDGLDVTALHGRELRRWRARAAMVFQQFNLIGRLDSVGPPGRSQEEHRQDLQRCADQGQGGL